MYEKKLRGFIILLGIIIIVLGAHCRSESNKEQTNRSIISGEAPPAGPAQNKLELSSVPKAASFSPDALVTLADGTAIEVASFAFYSGWRGFGGGMYVPTSGSEDWPLTIKVGPIWRRLPLRDLKTMELSDANRFDFYNMKMSLLDGTLIAGQHPVSGSVAWFEHGTFYLLGKSELLGRIGSFKCEFGNIVRIERVETTGPDKFRVTHKGESEGVLVSSEVTDPKMELIWEDVTPASVSSYTIGDDMPLQVQNTEVQVKPKEMDLIVPIPGQTYKFSIKMKGGDRVTTMLPERIFGKLANGDILFTILFEDGRPTIKSILIK